MAPTVVTDAPTRLTNGLETFRGEVDRLSSLLAKFDAMLTECINEQKAIKIQLASEVKIREANVVRCSEANGTKFQDIH